MPTPQPVLIAVEPWLIGSRTVPTVSLHDVCTHLRGHEDLPFFLARCHRMVLLREGHDYAPGGLVSRTANHIQDVRLTIPAARSILSAIRGTKATALNRDLVAWEQAVAAEGVGSTDTLPAQGVSSVHTLPSTNAAADFAQIGSLCTATEVTVGNRSALGIADARTLHTGLAVGRDYVTWIKDRIARFGFVEGEDYSIADGLSSPNPGSAKSRAQITKIYTITLDMAKELAMVENSDLGRLARRYFIWCERQQQAAQVPAPAIDLAGIRSLITEALAEHTAALPTMVDAALGHDRRVVREFKAPIQLLREMNVPQRGRRPLSRRVSARLLRYALATGRGGLIRESAETGRNLFGVDVIKDWLGHEGNTLISEHKARVMGQTVIPFGPKPL